MPSEVPAFSSDKFCVCQTLASNRTDKAFQSRESVVLHIPLVKAEREFIDVAAKMLLARVVIDPDQPALRTAKTLSTLFVVTPSRTNSPSL